MRSKYEIKAHKEKQKEGCEVDYKARPFRVPKGYTVDYFARFDLATWDAKTGVLGLIAIKGHQGIPSGLRKSIESFKVTKVVREIWTFDRKNRVRKEIIE